MFKSSFNSYGWILHDHEKIHYSVEKLPGDERPREKMANLGAESLSSIELIAVILGSGTKDKPVLQLAQDIMMRFGSLSAIAEATILELSQIRGMGTAKAMQLKASFHLGGRLLKNETPPRKRIDNPLHIYMLLKDQLIGETREHFVVVLVDNRGCVISHQTVSVGSNTHTIVHPREVFYPAIRHKANGILLAHNHPSGDPLPSKEDYDITKTLIQVGQMLEIHVHDHIIITDSGYTSMKQNGFMFS